MCADALEGQVARVSRVDRGACDALGVDVEPEVTGKYRVGDIRHCFADLSLSQSLLGYTPQVRLEDGLRELAGWLADQPAALFQLLVPITGLMHQSKKLDKKMLSSLNEKSFLEAAAEIQKALTDDIISKAFHNYPPEAYKLKGKQHEDILKDRLKKLPAVASRYYELIQK